MKPAPQHLSPIQGRRDLELVVGGTDLSIALSSDPTLDASKSFCIS